MPTKNDKCNPRRLYRFINCKVLRDHQIISDDLWVRDGRILNPEKVFFDEQIVADVVTDCCGLLAVSGFIDVQINGGFGVDFSVNTNTICDDVSKVASGILKHGVTSFCPTIVTSTPEVYKQILPQFKKTDGCIHGAGVLGVHLEGPFISKEKKGAHDESLINPSLIGGMDDIQHVYGRLDNVAIVTLAPELPGAVDVVRQLTARGIAVSLGHSVANLSEGEAGVAAGAKFITHLFNAMLPFHHRDPHLVGLLASHRLPTDASVFYGMISDGVHTHPAALRIAQRTHPRGIVLVTDAVSAMGLPCGIHNLGTQTVEVKNNRAVIAGTDTLCGSIATMSDCVKHFLKSAECSKVEALEAATLHPAQLLSIEKTKGTLDFGSDADFILLDSQLNVCATFVAGKLAWKLADITLPKCKLDTK